jgi:hypothetical protein
MGGVAPDAKVSTGTSAGAPVGDLPPQGEVKADWLDLDVGVEAFTVFIRSGILDASSNTEWHVIFRYGTIARVVDADPEWAGYGSAGSLGYKFPTHTPLARASALEGPLAQVEDQSTVADIMADNELVWGTQSRAQPSAVGAAVRRAYAKLIGQGYPYPGDRLSDREPVPSGLVDETLGAHWHVYWPNLDETGQVFNMVFSKTGEGAASVLSGDLRRYDYMFPEVTAVLTPAFALWKYDADGVFVEAQRPDIIHERNRGAVAVAVGKGAPWQAADVAAHLNDA